LKILRILGIAIAIFFLMGVVVSTRSIAPPPMRIDSLEEELAIKKTHHVREPANAVEAAVGTYEVPEWVRSEAMRTFTNTSMANSVNALKAWRSKNEFSGSLDERFGRTASMRPTPPAPEDSGSIEADIDWTTDRRVHTDATGQQFHPTCHVGSDGTIYVAWCRYVDSANSWVYFSKSTNGGDNWTSPVGVRTYGINNQPRIASYGSGSTADVYVTYTYWYDAANYDYDIYCGVSNNGGSSFATYVIRGSADYEDMAYVTTDNSGYVYIALCHAWVEGGGCDPDEAESEIVMFQSTNRGSSWSSGYYLTDYGSQHDDILPALAVQGGGTSSILHFAWVHDYSTSGSDYDVYYKKITNAGGTPTIPSSYVTIAGSGSQEYVIPGGIAVGPNGNPQIAYIYSTASSGNGDIYYSRSTDGGASFLSSVAISNRVTEETDAAIAVDAKNNPTVVWRDARDGNYDIYLNYSDDQGAAWRSPFKVNQDATTANQYWPGLGMWKEGWRRKVAVVWWDERYDDGDIYFNGNEMVGVSLDVRYIPSMPLWPLPGFSYRAFDAVKDTTFYSAASYQIWFDPEFTNDPLLDQLWAGSSSSERWAVDNPGGWTWIAGNYWMPPDTGGSYNAWYYHQYRVVFDAVKGNPPVCDHTLPNVDVHYVSFGNSVVSLINDAVSCTAWVDIGTAFNMPGWYELSPIQRWATNSPDTIGTVSLARIVQPYYYHQWKPIVLLVGPTSDNSAFTERHTQFGLPHAESGLYDRWEQWTDCGTTVDFSDTTVPDGWYAIDPTAFLCDGYTMRTIRYSNNTHVIIRNSFGYGNLVVDGVTVPAPDSVDWGPGSSHIIGAISPQTFGDTIRFQYSDWSDGGAMSHSIVVPEYDITYTANFNTQFKLDMEYAGSTGGYIPTLTGTGWYWQDSLATITASEGWDSTGGTRYGFSHWETIPTGAFIGDSTSSTTTIVMNRHYLVRAVYSLQYRLQVSSDGGYGTPNPPIGSNWIDAGAHICAEAGSPDLIDHMYATGWTGTGPVPPSGTGDVACFYMSAPGNITWRWAPQLTLRIISTYGVPSPMTGLHYYNPGDYVSCNVGTPFPLSGDTRASCIGYTGTSVIGSGATNFVDFNIVENCTLTWNWRIEYRLRIVNPTGYGEPLVPPVGDNWFPSGSMVMAKVNSPDPPMVCIGFIGTPPTLPATSPQDSIVFAMVAPATLQWQWAPDWEVCSLVVISTGGRGAPSPYGTTWWVPGSAVSASVTSPWPDPGDDGIRWLIDGYSGTGSAPSGSGASTGSFFIWTNSSITWNWCDEIRLLIDSEPGYYGAPLPDTGAHWFDRGTLVSGSVTTPWEDSVVCTGFTGTGSAPSSSSSSNFAFSLSVPSSVTWHWNISTVSLNVLSEYGSPSPAIGLHHYAVGAEIDLSVNRYHYISPVERWECVGWAGTGSVPPSGADTTLHVRVLVNSTIRWVWQRQFRLDVDNPGGYDTPVPPIGQHWFDAGTWVTCYITTNPVDTMFCVGFYGTGDCPSMWGMDEVSFIINQYSTIQWVWLGAGSTRTLNVVSECGDPFPPVGPHYYPHSVVVDCYMLNATDPIGPGERSRCQGWTGTGSVPASGADTSLTFTITANSNITWNWRREFSFDVLNPTGRGLPSPAVGSYWYAEGSTVIAEVTLNPDGAFVCTGHDGWGSVASGLGDSINIVITEPSGVEWLWEAIGDVYTLTVISPYGPCDPPVGVNYIPRGATITASAGPHSYDSPIFRNTATGWTGLGCVPVSGSDHEATITMTSNGTITWLWVNEFLLAMNYIGCGAAVPAQSGQGWYRFRDSATITTSSSVADGSLHYGFVNWSVSPSAGAGVVDVYWPSTYAAVMAACTLTANYAPAVLCSLVKIPGQDYGGFTVDGVIHDSIHEYTDWWGLGSIHTIGATSPDWGPGERYTFDSWSDGGTLLHNVGPITTSSAYRAYYRQHLNLHIEKSPYHTSGSIRVDGVEYADSGRIDLWFTAGTAPAVGVSDIDYESEGHRYSWQSWSDGGALNHLLDPIGAPVFLVANYNEQYRLKVAKSPLEDYGWISIDDSLYEFASSASRWFSPGTEHQINVSKIDVVGDSAYQFINFDGVFADTVLPKTVALSEPDSITAYYRGFKFILALDVTPLVWNLGLMFPDFIRTMVPSEVITVRNIGNIACDVGLTVIDTHSVWICGCSNGTDKIVFRGHFSNMPVPPATFHPAYDCIRETINWSTEHFFGPLGYNVTPGDGMNLWLQTHTPRVSSISMVEQVLIIRVSARVTLY